MKELAQRNPSLKDIFTQFDFVEFAKSPENTEILRQLIELFSAYSFENVSPDILGDAYEWILRYFAPQKVKEGEVYTPREVIRLMIEILDPKAGKWLYDPCHGSGGC
jgi:type I restriction enzyme M protein